MKIAYFVNQYPKVSHSFIRREILALERQGFEIERYALRGWDAELIDPEDLSERQKTRFVLGGGLRPLLAASLRRMVRQPRAFLRALGLTTRLWRGGERSLPLHLVSLAEAAVVAEWAERDGISHLHAHFGTNSAEVALLARALGGPTYSVTTHGADEWDRPEQLKLREKIEGSEFIVGISAFTRAQLMRWCRPQDLHKLHVVHCGVGESFHADAHVPVPDNRRFVCVGRLCRAKAQTLLVDAVALLRERGVPIELVLAGDGEERPDVEARIRQHRLEGQVRITGWIGGAQVRDELLAARGMVLPSLVEGLPVVIMEAMSLRRPVLATWVAGVPELVRHGVDGWLFEAGSVEAIAGALQACLETPVDALRSMGERARERVLERHDIDREAAKLAVLLRGVGR